MTDCGFCHQVPFGDSTDKPDAESVVFDHDGKHCCFDYPISDGVHGHGPDFCEVCWLATK